jgi:hypothetical protein
VARKIPPVCQVDDVAALGTGEAVPVRQVNASAGDERGSVCLVSAPSTSSRLRPPHVQGLLRVGVGTLDK